MSVIVADRKERTDGPAFQMLSQVNSSVPIVLMARTPHYRFNEDLLNLDRYILFEFSEMGWDWKFEDTHVWGKNTERFPQFSDEHYKRFDDFVASKPPLLTFTRELLKKDVTETHLPVDYPCWFQSREVQTKDQFNARPIDSFFFWGRSHESRLRLHANIWLAASNKGFSVCDNINFFDKFVMEEDARKWVSMWMPHYGRTDIKEILGRQQFSKTSIALPGAGVKTFRHCESSLNSVMVKWADELAWSFPWDETNCILTSEWNEISDIEIALNNPNLYDIYRTGIDNCQRYLLPNYIQYLEKIINEL